MFREICLKTLRRSMRKTLLLGLLMAMITIFFILGISMYVNSKSLLKQADESYTSLGFMEYTGVGYPNDEDMKEDIYNRIKEKDLTSVLSRQEVIAYHPIYLMKGNVEGVSLSRFYKNPYYNYSVIKFKVMYATNDGMYRCLLLDTLSGQEYMEGKTFGLSQEALAHQDQYQFKEGHIYIGHGDFRTEHMLMVFCPVEYEGSVDETSPSKSITDFPLVDITDNQDYMNTSDQGQYWQQIIDFYDVQEGSYKMLATDDLATYKDFYLGSRLLSEGRYWTDKEQIQGAKVCVIDHATAENGYHIGDQIPLRIHYSDDGKHPECSYDSREGFKQEDLYTVIGVYEQKTADLERYIFIPSGSLDVLPNDQAHYNMGCVELKNGTISSYEKATTGVWINHFNLNTFDQGYTATVEPIYAMLNNSILIIILCAVASIAVMILFAILLIVKQQESIAVMTALGTGKRNIRRFLLYGAGIIAGGGSLLGSIVAYLLSKRVVALAYDLAKNQYHRNMDYSSLAMGAQKIFHGELRGSIGLSLLVGIILFVAVMLLCVYYANQTIDRTMNFGGKTKRVSKNKKKNAIKQNGTVVELEISKEQVEPYVYKVHNLGERRFTGFKRTLFVLKQSIRSIVRNHRVAGVLLLVTGSLSLFMIFFAEGIEHYQNSLDQAYEKYQVEGYYTTYTGAPYNAHYVYKGMKETLEKSTCVMNTYESTAVKYEYISAISGEFSQDNEKLIEGLKLGIEQGEMPRTGFGLERRIGKIYDDPELIMTDKLDRTQEFFNETAPKVTYLSGYEDLWKSDASSMKDKEVSNITLDGKLLDQIKDLSVTRLDGIVTQQFLKDWKVNLGDDVLILQMYVPDQENYFLTKPIVLHIVGSYEGLLGENFIYIPTQTGALTVNNIDPDPTTINYHLTNLEQLNQLRQTLRTLKIGSVGELAASRICFVIDDKELIENVTNLQNNISFMKALKYVLYLLIFVIGFVASYLTMRTRREEIAIIRSLGTGTVRTFLMFFVEQMIVGLIGVAISVVIAFIIFGGFMGEEVIIITAFYVIYMLGCGVCIGRMNKKNVLAILSTAE